MIARPCGVRSQLDSATARIRSAGVAEYDRPQGVRLLMVRHGEAHCNVRGVVAGTEDCDGLTPRGYRQAAAVAMALATEQHNVAAVYSSPALRSVQTAESIAEAVGAPLLRTLPCPVFGQAEGRAWEDVLAELDCPVEPALDTPIAPGAESWSGWVQRTGASLDALAGKHGGQTVVLVAHKVSVQAAEQWFHHPTRNHSFWLIAADFASITEWEHCSVGHPTHRRWLWARHRHNDIAHQVHEARWHTSAEQDDQPTVCDSTSTTWAAMRPPFTRRGRAR